MRPRQINCDAALFCEAAKHVAALQENLARDRVVRGFLSGKAKRSAAAVWTVYRDIEKRSPRYAAWCMTHYGARAGLKRLVL